MPHNTPEKRRAYKAAWREKNREKVLESRRRWKRKKREMKQLRVAIYPSIRNNKLRSKYGAGLEEYNALHERQNGVCAICRQPETMLSRIGERRSLCWDHDHTTKQMRGLLCANCNNAIGLFGENPETMMNAIAYLAEYARVVA